MKLKLFVLPFSMTALMIVGCNNAQTPAESEELATPTEEVVNPDDTQTIRVATESNYKPFSYRDSEGNLIGFEIDLMHALCDEMQVQCSIQSQEFDGLIPGLLAKQFDVVIAALSITSDRLEMVSFTDPYYHTGLVFIAPKNDDVSFDTIPEGYSVGVQRSTVSSAYLEDNYPNIDIQMFDTQEKAYVGLVSGLLDAVLTDTVPAIEWLNTSDKAVNFEVKGEEISTDGDALGIAMRKNDPLVIKFNDALAELKANGQYDVIAAPYFGTETTAAANNLTLDVNEPVANAVSVNENAVAASDSGYLNHEHAADNATLNSMTSENPTEETQIAPTKEAVVE